MSPTALASCERKRRRAADGDYYYSTNRPRPGRRPIEWLPVLRAWLGQRALVVFVVSVRAKAVLGFYSVFVFKYRKAKTTVIYTNKVRTSNKRRGRVSKIIYAAASLDLNRHVAEFFVGWQIRGDLRWIDVPGTDTRLAHAFACGETKIGFAVSPVLQTREKESRALVGRSTRAALTVDRESIAT